LKTAGGSCPIFDLSNHTKKGPHASDETVPLRVHRSRTNFSVEQPSWEEALKSAEVHVAAADAVKINILDTCIACLSMFHGCFSILYYGHIFKVLILDFGGGGLLKGRGGGGGAGVAVEG
jgi:hypothetical protein